MEIIADKITNAALMRRACWMTMHGQESAVGLERMYMAEHSPIRTQLFWIEMYGIPSFVSVHLVRHKVGVEHFVQSHRDDRGGTGEETRWSPVNHAMLVNAAALIQISRKRLCYQSHVETRKVWQAVCAAIDEEDPFLTPYLVPECTYRGMCPELKSCGRLQNAES